MLDILVSFKKSRSTIDIEKKLSILKTLLKNWYNARNHLAVENICIIT